MNLQDIKEEARKEISHKWGMLESDWGIDQKRDYALLDKYIDLTAQATRERDIATVIEVIREKQNKTKENLKYEPNNTQGRLQKEYTDNLAEDIIGALRKL